MADNQIETFKKQLHRELQFREKTNRMMPEIPELKKAFRDREMNKIHREKQTSSNSESEHFREMIQNQRDRLNHVNNHKIDLNDELSREINSDDDRIDQTTPTITTSSSPTVTSMMTTTKITNSSNLRKNSSPVSAELENVFRQIAKKNNIKQ